MRRERPRSSPPDSRRAQAQSKTGGPWPPEFVTRGRSRKPDRGDARERSGPRRSTIAPRCRRLIGDARMIAAIGNSCAGFAAAEIKVRLPRIADRPMTLLVIELEQRAALAE